jgi:hypothetical protein
MRIWCQCGTRLFKNGDGQCSAHGWEVVKEDFERITRFQVVEQRFDRDSCTTKNGRTAMDLWVNDDQLATHAWTPVPQQGASVLPGWFVDA